METIVMEIIAMETMAKEIAVMQIHAPRTTQLTDHMAMLAIPRATVVPAHMGEEITAMLQVQTMEVVIQAHMEILATTSIPIQVQALVLAGDIQEPIGLVGRVKVAHLDKAIMYIYIYWICSQIVTQIRLSQTRIGYLNINYRLIW